MKLNLAETFTSIQGEGHLVGNITHFVRFAGCSVSECVLHPAQTNLCDTIWRTKQTLCGEEEIDAVAKDALNAVGQGGWVSITGGEPADQPEALGYVAADVRSKGMQLQIQTSGKHHIVCPWDWLTLSPKTSLEKCNQRYGQELKIIYNDQTAEELIEWKKNTKFWYYYLQPLWKGDQCNMRETIDMIYKLQQMGFPYLLSVQMHKWAGVP